MQYIMAIGTWCVHHALPGVNGNNTHAVKALAGTLAAAQGIGKGEFSAWLNNLRAICTSLGALLLF